MNPTPHLRVLIGAWLTVLAIWALSGWFLVGEKERGTFGDMFGAVNALFSGLALATLIYAAWMQRAELQLQREELESTKLELDLQRKLQIEQTQTQSLQRFESTFFELLRVHGQIVDSIDLVNEAGVVTRSRDCFRIFYRRLNNAHAAHAVYPDRDNPLPAVQNVYERFYEEHQSEIGHYFRHLYHIFKFVRESSVEEKRRYTSLVRAQLSSYEQVLLFYNGLSKYGVAKFKPLIEEFALLENMPQRLLIGGSLHLQLYPSTAYGEDSAP